MNTSEQTTQKGVKSVEEFIDKVHELKGGTFLYRGQADVQWDVEPSALRRLRRHVNNKPGNITPKKFQDHTTSLLDRTRKRGFGLQNGQKLFDLELLAKLQHSGAATCLIDFTINSFAALWFACSELNKSKQGRKNGRVVVINIDNLEKFVTPEYDEMQKTAIEQFLKTEKLHIWKPRDMNKRVIAQQSVFIFGKQKIEKGDYDQIIIDMKHKEAIIAELEILGISEENLFRDFPAYALSNAHDKPIIGHRAEKNP